MKYFKITKDWLLKFLLGPNTSPRGLVELARYFALFGPINFKYHKESGGIYVATSIDFKYGTIITSASSLNGLDKEIKDAILTSFGVPSSYAKEASIRKQGEKAMRYAIA